MIKRTEAVAILSSFLQALIAGVTDDADAIGFDVGGENNVIIFSIKRLKSETKELPRVVGRQRLTLYAIQRLMHVVARKYEYDCHVELSREVNEHA